MAPRLQLHQLLKDLLGSDYVYFQPPNGTKMRYPCIVYQRDFADTAFADNRPYRIGQRYRITIIDQDPDNATRDKIANLPTSVFNRFYTADELNHDVYYVYF